MKVVLSLLLCSYIAETCLPPYIYPVEFEDDYTCLMVGYEQSIKKLEDIGPEAVNEHRMYVAFNCVEILDEGKNL